MDFQSLITTYSPHLKKYWIALLVGCIGLTFFIYGLIALFAGKKQQADIRFESSVQDLEEKVIVVDVGGAVVRPGVYRFSSGARLQDALVAAGGVGGLADREWIGKHINLALPLKDADKIYIPFTGEQITGVAGTGEESVQGQSVNINSATAAELDTLNGVGPVTAEKIISNRPYGSVEDLLTKKVVTSSVFEKIKGRVVVY